MPSPSPPAGEGGENERSEFETGEGFRSLDRRPLTRLRCAKAPSSHKGRGEEETKRAALRPPPCSTVDFCFDAFPLREPVPTSLGNAMGDQCAPCAMVSAPWPQT